MRIHARDAVEEFVANRFTGDNCSSGEDLFDNGGISRCWFLFGKPFGAAATGAATDDVIHVLHDNG